MFRICKAERIGKGRDMENIRLKRFTAVVLASFFAVFLLVVPFLTIFIVGTATGAAIRADLLRRIVENV